MINAMPMEVGGTRRTTTRGTEAAETMNRVKFKHERTRFGKAHEFLRLALEEAIRELF